MTQQQILWAKSHDWFRASNGRSVLVEDVTIGPEPDNKITSELREFTSFAELRRFAGY